MDTAGYKGIWVEQHSKQFLQLTLPASLIAKISYAAVRGRDNEPGAIQRVLSTRRISSIKDFMLSGGDFPSNIILNWAVPDHPILANGEMFQIPEVERAAQIIDGQHRVAGMRAAIEEKPEMGSFQVPVSIYDGLSPQQCANIFLAINTEQKPVPKSLVYDLYELAGEALVDDAALRARDIVDALNSEDGSPYFGMFKYPGEPRRKGGIALSTAVTELKPLFEKKGDFEQIGLDSLETQKLALMNFWGVIASKCGDRWGDPKNAFQYASGFSGGIEFFKRRLIPYCAQRRSFRRDLLERVIRLEPSTVVLQEEVKGVGGKDAPRVVFDRLVSLFEPQDAVGEFDV
ncbi:DGQHR domain-containing protein [Azospirillum sp. TSA6c]|uniref:DGQHR domain-containing protein n=1 Tax=unclassified Azospirillum TaxID=2630922 RepID=UPI0018EE93CE|nr:DGQHR domain-containing protein [Azospirillum sp. TSA6c]